MHINITVGEIGNNKGSCAALVNYLEKENREKENGLPTLHPEYWFNEQSQHIQAYRVKMAIDKNIARLGGNDAKFYLLNISPSQKELAHLRERNPGFDLNTLLKSYAVKIMDEYARNFHRIGVNRANDLLWFGKIEKHRRYSYKDKEVKSGQRRKGELQPGDQWHIQIIISRKDKSNLIKLSPLNNSRGRNATHAQKMGQFDRKTFAMSGERIFDELFNYQRALSESFHFANTIKNGSQEDRMTIMGNQPARFNSGLSATIPENLETEKNWQEVFKSALIANPPPEEYQHNRRKKKRRPEQSPNL